MRTRIIYLAGVVCLCLIACQSNEPASEAETDIRINQEITVEGETMLVGKVDRNGFDLPAYTHWFDSTYQAYPLNTDIITSLKPQMSDVTLKVYLSTWCSDTRRDVPALIRILDDMEIGPESIEMIALNRDMESPGGEQEGYNIEFVPTTIFYRGNDEIGRIIEYPNTTLEEDMLVIVARQ